MPTRGYSELHAQMDVRAGRPNRPSESPRSGQTRGIWGHHDQMTTESVQGPSGARERPHPTMTGVRALLPPRRALVKLSRGLMGIVHPTDTEEAYVVMRTRTNTYELIWVPNRHEDPENHVRWTKRDVGELRGLGDFQLVGFAHTHLPKHLDGPSYEDIVQLPRGLFGAVLRLGSGKVHWYDRQSVFYVHHPTTSKGPS